MIWVSGTGGVLNGYCEGPALAEVFGEAPAALDYSDFYDRPMDAGGGLHLSFYLSICL